MSHELDLFGSGPACPAGLEYHADVLSLDEEVALLDRIEALPFKPFEFRGFTGKRRVVSFGWKYDYAAGSLLEARDIPEFLLPLRAVAARLAALVPAALQQVLVTEYAAGAGIGWHRDKPMFGDVVGVSLLSPCVFRMRRQLGRRWERLGLPVEPRSAYVLKGSARTDWEHSIPPVPALRYSVTFRSLRVAPQTLDSQSERR